MSILDSGTRREFDTGAVRDIQEGKGRCDLLPLRVITRLLNHDSIISCIADFMEQGNTTYLYAALLAFCKKRYSGKLETMTLEVAVHFEEGSLKYGENNWQKGLPPSCYMDSAVRHYLKWSRGDQDEPHDRAFVWNILCCIWEVDHHHD